MTIDELEVNVLQTIKLNLVVPHNPFPMWHLVETCAI
jgi:hypothetical protein